MKKFNLSISLIALLLCIACGSKSSNGNSTENSVEVDSDKTVQLLEPTSNVINDLHSIGVSIDDQNIDEDDCYYAKLTNNSGQELDFELVVRIEHTDGTTETQDVYCNSDHFSNGQTVKFMESLIDSDIKSIQIVGYSE